MPKGTFFIQILKFPNFKGIVFRLYPECSLLCTILPIVFYFFKNGNNTYGNVDIRVFNFNASAGSLAEMKSTILYLRNIMYFGTNHRNVYIILESIIGMKVIC